MGNATREFAQFISLLDCVESSTLVAMCNVGRKIAAAVRAFGRGDIRPQTFERLERQLECLFRELARLLLQWVVGIQESRELPGAIEWEDRTFRPYDRACRSMDTRVGTIQYARWLYRTEYCFVADVIPLDRRLGLTGDRISPGVAHQLGRLAADMPQQPALQQLREQFGIRMSVESYRRVVTHLSDEIRYVHDDIAIEQLQQWLRKAVKTKGKHDVLLLVGRDGVHVPMRGCWKEAACATLAVYDRNRHRLGTIYLGEMPEERQRTMTKRLTRVIEGALQTTLTGKVKLRYVTDAGQTQRSYYRNTLSRMKHPLTGRRLQWDWGVDFYHACEYVSLLSDALFGAGTAESQAWFRTQRHALRHDRDGIQQILRSAGQIRRRHLLKGQSQDFDRARGYLHRYRSRMNYAAAHAAGNPIGSGITEAGCKVIFNQRMKQSGMRWSKRGGQRIIDLRTACRSKLWDTIWKRGIDRYNTLPDMTRASHTWKSPNPC